MANMFALSAVGRDEPGIIAAMTQALFELHCNLADINMSVLSGHFSMVLIVEAPPELTSQQLQTRIEQATQNRQLMTAVQKIERAVAPAHSVELLKRESALITVYGADRPGMVHNVAAAIARSQSNIVDLRTQQFSRERALYSIFLEVQLGQNASCELLEQELATVAARFGVQVQVQPLTEMEAL